MDKKGILKFTAVLICAIFINLQSFAQQDRPNLRMAETPGFFFR